MDAFILAAGLGTRLRPLTDGMPKALVPVAGVSMLERVARRLIAAGADRLIVNVHHHAEQVIRSLQDAHGFGVPWVVSYEADRPLDTGGALLHARDLIRREAPFFLHNVDVLTDFPLEAMYAGHLQWGAAATVAVSNRPSQRGLVFGATGLVARYDGDTEWRAARPGGAGTRGNADARSPDGATADDGSRPHDGGPARRRRFAFGGVHVVSPRVLERIQETGAFSVLDLYLRLAGEGELIAPYPIDGHSWIDIGTPEKLAVAEAAYALSTSAAAEGRPATAPGAEPNPRPAGACACRKARQAPRRSSPPVGRRSGAAGDSDASWVVMAPYPTALDCR